jgi:hypothetical protein
VIGEKIMTDQVKKSEQSRLSTLIAMATNGNVQVVADVFERVYGNTYSIWCLHEVNVRDGTFALDSAEAKKFLKSYDPLITAFKEALHELIDAI